MIGASLDWWQEKLACPSCGRPLECSGKRGRCPSGCTGGEWDLLPGRVSFLPASPYWGEVPLEQMREANRQSQEGGWRRALAGPLAEIRRSVEAANRADWLYELVAARDLEVLDLGSGLGQIAYLLARAGHRVWSCEAVAERLEFQRLRRDQEKLEHRLALVQANIAERLPLLSGSFDVAVMNGVLEWVGASRAEGDPRDIQIEVLGEVRRILRPGGVLRLAIENRIGYPMWLGSLDHSGLPFTSLLPRTVAGCVVRAAARRQVHRTEATRQGYRTYTYTPWGYRRLLRQCGFGEIRQRWVLPGYNDPRVAGELTGRPEIRFMLRSLMMRGGAGRALRLRVMSALCALGFFSLFAPHLEICAQKEART